MADIYNIAGRIHSTSQEAIAVEANEVYDPEQQKRQSEINSMVASLNHEDYVNYSATSSAQSLADILPSTGEVNRVYRVANWDGRGNDDDPVTYYNENCYSEYVWNASTSDYTLLSVSDRGIDSEPTADSENLVKSGGVFTHLVKTKNKANALLENQKYKISSSIALSNVGLIQSDGIINTNPTSPYRYSDFISVIPGDTYYIDEILLMGNSGLYVSLYTTNQQTSVDLEHSFVGDNSGQVANFLIPNNINFIRVCARNVTTITLNQLVDTYKGIPKTINGASQFQQYNFISGLKYKIVNTGTVSTNVYYSITGEADTYVTIVSQLAVNDTYTYDCLVDASFIYVSAGYGSQISIQVYGIQDQIDNIEDKVDNLDDLPEQVEELDNYTKAELTQHSTETIIGQRSFQSYNFISGIKYKIVNTGNIQTNVYYSVTGEDDGVLIAHLDIGDSYTFNCQVSANFIYVSYGGVSYSSQISIQQYGVVDNLNDEIDNLQDQIDNLSLNIKVGTYNVGDFSGTGLVTPSDEGSLTYRKTIASLDVNVLGTQDDVLYYGGLAHGMDEGEDVRVAIYPMFKQMYRTGTRMYNYKSFCSDYTITNVDRITYTIPQEASYTFYSHGWFLKGILKFKSEQILLISLHFDWEDVDKRSEQIRQVLAYCENFNKVIILGDTNPCNYSGGVIIDPDNPYVYETEWNRFNLAGFSMANGGIFGYYNTCYDTLINEWFPVDNIFVKGGKIKRVWMVSESYMNDHKPICAEIIF